MTSYLTEVSSFFRSSSASFCRSVTHGFNELLLLLRKATDMTNLDDDLWGDAVAEKFVQLVANVHQPKVTHAKHRRASVSAPGSSRDETFR
jgi:hypothetical protein